MRDITSLKKSKYDLRVKDEAWSEFEILLPGPEDSPYEQGLWKLHVLLPDNYPYKSPSIGFLNKIYHPNVDEPSGSVCLDVINQTWSPMYELTNIFSVFLPQLLLYPNPTDPLNEEAARLMLKSTSEYHDRIKKYVRLYANPDDVRFETDRKGSKDLTSSAKKRKISLEINSIKVDEHEGSDLSRGSDDEL